MTGKSRTKLGARPFNEKQHYLVGYFHGGIKQVLVAVARECQAKVLLDFFGSEYHYINNIPLVSYK
jgi:hypothetical protein